MRHGMKLSHKQFLRKRSKRKPVYITNEGYIGETKYDLMSDGSIRRNPRVIRGKAFKKAYKRVLRKLRGNARMES